jgi:tetratricopeptide (TPR) repeat protein
MRRRILLATIVLVATAVSARAQCPDGAPPPCKGRTPAGATARRAAPALNARSWIVVPFTNATRTADLDWLRDATVNLLTLDLGRWSDLRVVDDKHVGDLLRELPASRATQSLTLNDGLTIARRAGAANLVMGDYFKVGKGTRFVVNVFDVQRGSRIRTFTQQASDQDSVLSAFGPMARGVLALPAPADGKLGVTGTTRVDAYQEYLLGSTALNRFEITEARKHLERALALDSSFALAHYKLAVALHWDADTSEATHALAAARLSATLPARERALINARVAVANGDYERACAGARALVAKDSMDVDALYTVGECEYHGGRVVGTPIDSAHGRFVGNWNAAIASFRRVLAIDPTYHPAFEHILNALSPPAVFVCARPTPRCANDPLTTWSSPVVREGDSLVITPVRPGSREYTALQRRAEANRTSYLNFLAARQIAQDWVESSQHGPRAQLNLGIVNIYLGELATADDALRQIRPDADADTRRASLYWRLQIAAQRADGVGGRTLLDSLRRIVDMPNDSALYASYAVAFGKLQPAMAVIRRTAGAEQWSSEKLRYMRHMPRIMLGLPAPELAEDERRYWNTVAGDTLCLAGLPSCRTTALLPSLGYAVRVNRTWWPSSLKEQPLGVRFYAAWALATNSRENMKFTLRYLDSLSRVRLRNLGDEQSSTIIAADAALAIGDSVGALNRIRFAADSILPFMYNSAIGVSVGGLVLKAPVAPRIMLLRADLAAALGFRDESRLWYTRVLDLWAEADPELQPTVTRIRAALGALP